MEKYYDNEYFDTKKISINNIEILPIKLRITINECNNMIEFYIIIKSKIFDLENELVIFGLKKYFKKNKNLPKVIENEITSFF